MLSADVRFEGFTATDWSRVLALFSPRIPTGGERDPDRPKGGVIAVHGDGRLRKLVHTQAGRMRLDDIAPDLKREIMESIDSTSSIGIGAFVDFSSSKPRSVQILRVCSFTNAEYFLKTV